MSFLSMDASASAKRSSWSPSVSQDAKENQAGVGILFVEEEDPSGFVRVTVKALIEGGSAEKTGMVKAGDMVVRVGNQDVIGKPLSILRSMIPGPIGSYCRLGFLRGGVALNSNAVQEKSTYFDVQLLRQPTKNEKRKLVAGGMSDLTSDASSGSSSLYSSQSTQKAAAPLNSVVPARETTPQITDTSSSKDTKTEEQPTRTIPLSQSQPTRASPPQPQSEAWSANKPTPLSATSSWSEGDSQNRKTWSPSVLGAFQNQVQQQLQSSYSSSQQRASAQQTPSPEYTPPPPQPTSAPAPGLSQSFDQRSGSLGLQPLQPLQPTQPLQPSQPTQPTQPRRSPESDGVIKSSTLSSSVDAAISNVDKALYEMQNREMERLSSRLSAAERDRKSVEEELSGEQRRRKELEQRVMSLEESLRTGGSMSSLQSAPQPVGGLPPDVKRKLDMLEKQVTNLKQEKQIEEMKRLEAESAYKALERRTNENKNNNIQRQSLPGNQSLSIMQLEQKVADAENKRREEEKKRAILEGKLRHAENTIKQQSPFKYQNMKTKKGPPAHMPDIAEGKEEIMGAQNMTLGVQPTARSPSLGAIDGPLPAALVPKWGSEEMQYIPMPGANGMVAMVPGGQLQASNPGRQGQGMYPGMQQQPVGAGMHPGQQNGLYNSMGMNKPPGMPGPGSPNQGQSMQRSMLPGGQQQGQQGMAPQRQPMQPGMPGQPGQG
eukprot:CAMPEP_0177691916 /NCGR_PEP_ID=MMETSP0484_2-20121128/1568_1 /TAXON_ID=354590 /ORGANISM="Rhodomonas lens, Strain RHODO" /LENGTH=714 /DNA_ID=CAMNT_0019202585 /DNA_START=158 /DNA_END=2299 /DNA_ORIENTATION=+